MSASFDGAVIREQGITFACVVVKPHVLNSNTAANQAIASFSAYFPSMPVVLAARGSRGLTYFGRKDISRFLASVSPSRIPWKRYTFSR